MLLFDSYVLVLVFLLSPSLAVGVINGEMEVIAGLKISGDRGVDNEALASSVTCCCRYGMKR